MSPIRVAAVTAIVFWSTGSWSAGPGPSGQDKKLVDAGRKIYAEEKCNVCHQIAGQGNSRFPLDGVAARLTADQIRRWFTHTEEMENALPVRPAIRMSSTKYDFSDAELDALVAYLLTLK